MDFRISSGDLYWNLIPGKVIDIDNQDTYFIRGFSIEFFDITSIIGVGGICLWLVQRSMSRERLCL